MQGVAKLPVNGRFVKAVRMGYRETLIKFLRLPLCIVSWIKQLKIFGMTFCYKIFWSSGSAFVSLVGPAVG